MKNKDVLFLEPKNTRNGLGEVASYPEKLYFGDI